MNNSGVCDSIVKCNLDDVENLCETDLAFSLCRFVREVKKLDESDYPPNTLCEMIIMVQMYLNEHGIYWKLLDGDRFKELRNVVDNTMKEGHEMGLGVRKSSDVISRLDEDELFDKGILGGDTPMKLLKTVIYMVG